MALEHAALGLVSEQAPFNVAQRIWLDGYLAGMLSGADLAGGGRTPAVAAPTRPLAVVYASQTGTAESLARKTAKQARTARLRGTRDRRRRGVARGAGRRRHAAGDRQHLRRRRTPGCGPAALGGAEPRGGAELRRGELRGAGARRLRLPALLRLRPRIGSTPGRPRRQPSVRVHRLRRGPGFVRRLAGTLAGGRGRHRRSRWHR